MKRVVRLTESDLARIVKRVIRENDMTEIFGFGKKRKERKEKEGIEDKMREEIRNFNWATPFAEPSQNDRMDGNWTKIKNLVKIKMNRAKQEMPTVAMYHPELFEVDDVLRLQYPYKGDFIEGFVSDKFRFMRDEDAKLKPQRECERELMNKIFRD
jgi:hypothetical protein